MGVRFDKWLARPSTLHFLRQLIGPEHHVARTKRPCWTSATATTTTNRRQYATRKWFPAHKPTEPKSDDQHVESTATSSPELFRERRKRVAQELGLRIPLEDEAERPFDTNRPAPSSTSYSDLLSSEAHVRTLSPSRRLLIDEPENFANLEAWNKILQYRGRIDAIFGIVDVWKGMRARGINLPVEGQLADTFWSVFLHAAIVPKPRKTHQQLLEEIFAHAVELKASGLGQYRSLYSVLIGRFLRVAPPASLGEFDWHRLLCEHGFGDAHHLCDVVDDVFRSKRQPVAFVRWRKLYHDFEICKIYDECMPAVFRHAGNDKDDTRLIVRFHNLLISNDDFPSTEFATNPSVKSLLGVDTLSGRSSSPTRSVTEQELAKGLAEERKNAEQAMSPFLTRASMSGFVGDVHGIKAKPISDKFCARMFATQAFSLETIIRGLALLGTEAIGPVALRELAIRAGSPEILKENLLEIKNAGMSVTPSVYGSILEQVVANSQTQLYQALLDSDQHPESYDDQHTQETLFTKFLEAEQWSLAHVTLIGLSRTDWKRAGRAWSRLLQFYIKSHNYQEIVRTFDHICSEDMDINLRSLNFMMKYLLAERAPGKRPMVASNTPTGNFIPINFVVNAHMYAASRGAQVLPNRWKELMRRYGMSSNMNGLSQLSQWLVAQYPSQGTAIYTRDHSKLFRGLGESWIQAKIFTSPMIMALLIWGHQSASRHDNLLSSPSLSSTASGKSTNIASWARGLDLLLHLKTRGVQVKTDDVRHAMAQVLWTLYGPSISKRDINLEAMRRNQLTILDYVKHANQVWDEPLFDVSSNTPEKPPATREARTLVAVFGHHRLVDQKTGTWVDIEAWAAARDAGEWQDLSPVRKDRKRQWPSNTFTFVDNFATRKERQAAHRRQRELKPSQISSPQHPQPSAQTTSWHPLPSQPNTPEGS